MLGSQSKRGLLVLSGVLVGWVGVSIHDGVLVEHLTVRFVLSKTLEVGNLISDLRLDLAELLRNPSVWETSCRTISVIESGLVLVSWDDVFVTLDRALDTILVVVRTPVSEGWSNVYDPTVKKVGQYGVGFSFCFINSHIYLQYLYCFVF